MNLVRDNEVINQRIVSNLDRSYSLEKKEEKQKMVINKIIELLEKHKLYLNPDLTIVHIAEKIGEHPRLVSESINRICKENFNCFINKYRVLEAQKLLRNQKSEHLNMEGIGMEAGFNSNSSFYSTFKKELNITLLQFLKNPNFRID